MVPGLGCGIIIINTVSLLCCFRYLGQSTFLPLCFPEDIYSPFSAVLYNGNDIKGKTDKQLHIRVLDVS